MPELTIQDALALAIQHHQARRLQEAEQLYRQILARQPDHPDALHHFGLIANQAGRSEAAVELIRRAIALSPSNFQAHFNLGIALRDSGQLEAAIAAYVQSIILRPNFPEAHRALANALHLNPSFDAQAIYRQLLVQIPNDPDAMYSLGMFATQFGQPEQAVLLFASAIKANPNEAEYHDSLGTALKTLGKVPKSVASFERAIPLRPDWDDARCRLSAAMMEQSPLSPSTCKLSYIIASRNDDFCGNPMERLRVVLRHLLQIGGDFEVIVADWGSDTPIYDVMRGTLPASGKIRFLHIPQSVTKCFNTRFSEVHALNAAARRSWGIFVGRLDQDTLIGRRFAAWSAHVLEADDPRAYFSIRRDLPPNVFTIQRNAPVWGGHTPDGPDFATGAVGILLAPRRLWHWTRGYDERLLFRNYMENDLCQRFASLTGLRNLGSILDCDFYHLWHEKITGTPNNPDRPMDQLAIEAKRNPRLNDENWGLGNFDAQLTEQVL